MGLFGVVVGASPGASGGGGVGPDSALVVVRAYGLESDRGSVRFALFDGPEGFTDTPVAAELVAPEGLTAEWTIRVAYGTYALAVVHDEDGDGRLDTNLLGMPTERYGFSNDARGRFGPPSFQDASLGVGEPAVAVSIEVR